MKLLTLGKGFSRFLIVHYNDFYFYNKKFTMRKTLFFFILGIIIHPITAQKELTVESIWKKYEFVTKGVSGFNGMNDGVHFTKITDDDGKQSITKHRISDYAGSGDVLVKSEDLIYNGRSIDISDYQFNDDESKMLLITEVESIYRRSYNAVHYLMDMKSKKIEPLDTEHSPQTLAEYSPDGMKVSYIYKNDLFVKDLASGKIKKLTDDGKKNKVINGTTDWVYEEEFALTKAYDWSPDSKTIAFLKFNEKKVKEFTMTYYMNELYPEEYSFKYPKAGEDNSKVTLHTVSVSNGKISNIALGEYEYIPRLTFSPIDNQLIVQTLNRHQNHVKYYIINTSAKKPVSNVFHEEIDKAYVEIDDNLLILNDGKSLIRTSEKDGYNHIYMVGFDGSTTQITKGSWDVIELHGIDTKNENIYFSSAEFGTISKTISKIRVDGSNKTLISLDHGYNDAEFTNGMNFFVKTYSDANTPSVSTLCDNSGKELAVLQDNSALYEKLSSYSLGKKEFFTINLEGRSLNAWMLKPANFDPSKKYPVYMIVYGGPGHNEVIDSWGGMNLMYHQLLVQKGYIVVSVDPRGTMYRGAEFKKSTYLQLGKLETEDFIDAAKYLQKQPFVDPARIGIQGWSYGGFMSSLCITKGADVFKAAIAVAPVTNWKFYDNIYTERFMRTPKENPTGYEENSPVNFAKLLKGKYLLIHGSGDDNVHYQNTMEMINAMVAADKDFEHFIYPNKNHGIYGGNTRNHLFRMMLNFTLENL